MVIARKRILVIGDAMLDTYVHGVVERMSPEAPVPVVRFLRKTETAGGAANVAHNIASLGGNATFLSVCGNDPSGESLIKILKKKKIRAIMLRTKNRHTTEKQRIVNDTTHVVRVDYEITESLPKDIEKKFISLCKKEIPKHDAVMLSDYAKGVLSPRVMKACIAAARTKKIPIILAPKPKDASYISHIKGISLLIPNRSELAVLAGKGDPKVQAKRIVKLLQVPVLTTLGADGMLLTTPDGHIHQIPSYAKHVVDVSGAGDTVGATLVLALASGYDMESAMELANRAAALVIAKPGTATLTLKELTSVL